MGYGNGGRWIELTSCESGFAKGPRYFIFTELQARKSGLVFSASRESRWRRVQKEPVFTLEIQLLIVRLLDVLSAE
jgi:hypothetical protein